MALQRFAGFIDVHVHLRDPGATAKEDFGTGTRAAVKGGFTYVLDMPNNPIPTFSPEALAEKRRLAGEKAVCDVGFHYGTNGRNTDTFAAVWNEPDVFGLKLYCNHTTGDYLIDDPILLENAVVAWEADKPILVHAEGEKLALVLALGAKYRRHIHVCHITLPSEVTMVREAKAEGQRVSAGVCPHHLFLTSADVATLGSRALMKPPLGTASDQDALWEGLTDGTIDLVETDHAPHTEAEKRSEKPPFGVPGLETAAGLLFLAVRDGRLKAADVPRLLTEAPRRIFRIPEQPDTYIELDPDVPYTIGADGYASKCGWSPFDGRTAYGAVQSVRIRGKQLVTQGKLVG